MNKKLTSIFFSLVVILIILLAFTYEDIIKSFGSNEGKAPAFSDDLDKDDTHIEDPGSSLNEEVPSPSPSPTEPPVEKEPIVLSFAGDVNLDEDSKPVARYDKEDKGILGVIPQDLVD